MTKLKKPAGAYLIGVAVIVAAFFITNPLLSDLLDPAKVWAVLDILMLIGLLTAGVTILFLHNWFSLLAQGPESLAGNHQAWVIWAAVDTMLPLVLATTGCRIMREKS